MSARLDYQWHLRQVMATRGMFATTDLLGPLAERGIRLSSSQVYRLVTDRPERLSLLYVQQPATISRLALGHVQPSGSEMHLRLGQEPVVLPEPLAGLICT